MELLGPAVEAICKEYLKENLKLNVREKEVWDYDLTYKTTYYVQLVLGNDVISEVFIE